MRCISFIKIMPITAFLAVTGCATTTGLSQSQCDQLTQNATNWQKLGEQDGLMGRDSGYFNQHLQACSKKTVLIANQADSQKRWQTQWETGRQTGLKKYCTPLRAYQLGREGFNYQNVCPSEQMVELLKANDEGLYNYQRQQNLQDWDDDFFPFGWGYNRHFNSSGYGHWGGRFYIPTPRMLPNYVPESKVKP